jgi:hypothetical protein
MADEKKVFIGIQQVKERSRFQGGYVPPTMKGQDVSKGYPPPALKPPPPPPQPTSNPSTGGSGQTGQEPNK